MKQKHLLLLSFIILSVNLNARDYFFGPNDLSAIKALLSNGKLSPGDKVILRDGTYSGWDKVEFTAKGLADAPITLTAENKGKAIITGALNLKIYGEYLVIDGLLFHKAWAIGHDMIDMRKEEGVTASHCRITNCVFDDCNDPQKDKKSSEYWIGLRGHYNRVDHCYFVNKIIAGIVVQVWLQEDSYENYHQIDHNFFGQRPPLGGNGAEIIRIGHSWSSQHPSCTIVEDNIFYHCNGENETISVKSCDNIIRRNLFYENQGGLVCRHGHNNLLEGNVFLGNGLPRTLGIRIINQGHKVYNNYLQDITGRGSDAALVIRMGVFEKPDANTDIKKEPLTSYHRVVDVDIAFNTFVNCTQLDFGQGAGDKEPRGVRFANNLIYNPTVNSNIQISNPAIFPGILFRNNYFRFAADSDFHMEGFQPAHMVFEKTSATPSPGIYRFTTDQPLEATKEFTYIREDLTGTPLEGRLNAGAVQLSNREKHFHLHPITECGTSWYNPLEELKSTISKSIYKP